jgi:hypothetical protein
VESGAGPERMELHVMAERGESAREPVERHESAAAFEGAGRGRAEDREPQDYRP